jgi:hypothetical protein
VIVVGGLAISQVPDGLLIDDNFGQSVLEPWINSGKKDETLG